MKSNLTYLLIFLLSFQSAFSLAVIQPMPANLTLKGGESLKFRFEVQTMTSEEKQLCTYSVSGLNPLTIVFDEEKVMIDPGKTLGVYGTIKVPFYAPTKEYDGKLTVSCRPMIEAKGVSVITQTTEFPFNVLVIESEKPYINRVFILVVLTGLIFGLYIKKIYSKKLFKLKKSI